MRDGRSVPGDWVGQVDLTKKAVKEVLSHKK